MKTTWNPNFKWINYTYCSHSPSYLSSPYTCTTRRFIGKTFTKLRSFYIYQLHYDSEIFRQISYLLPDTGCDIYQTDFIKYRRMNIHNVNTWGGLSLVTTLEVSSSVKINSICRWLRHWSNGIEIGKNELKIRLH